MLDATWTAIREKFYGNTPIFELAKEFKIKAPVIQGFFRAYEAHLLNPANPFPNPATIKYKINVELVKAAYLSGLKWPDIVLFYGVCESELSRFIKTRKWKRRALRDCSEAIRLYQSGLSLKETEAKTGIAASTIQKALSREGIKARSSGSYGNIIGQLSSQKAYVLYLSLPWNDIESDFGKGQTVTAIAEKHGITRQALSKYLKRRGIEVPHHNESLEATYAAKYSIQLQAVDWKDLKQKYENCFSWRELSRDCGLPVERIRRELVRRFGIKIRSCSETLLLRKKHQQQDWSAIGSTMAAAGE